MELEVFRTNGYVVQEFHQKSLLREAQQLVKSQFQCNPVEWHKQDISHEQHVAQVKKTLDALLASRLVTRIIQDNKDEFVSVLGPDLDVQASPHVRITRPEIEGDAVDWHRDSFYGSTVWELNVWFPLFPLDKGAGIRILPGSHAKPSRNIRDGQESNAFRKTVSKGSVAHQIGFVYAPKTDDTLSGMNPADTILVAPDFGSFVTFFGCAVHKGQNRSALTRISVDVRIKNSFTPTNTKPGYYECLARGVLADVAQQFHDNA
jgi:hypothetical protein